MQKLREFELLRGLGISLVVFGHCLDPFLDRAGVAPLKSLIYAFHIPLFFFISGFFGSKLFRRGETSLADKLGAQAVRLLLPYLFCSVAAIPIKVLLNRFAGRPLHLQEAWQDILLYPHQNPMIHLWFLYALFLIQALFLAFHHSVRVDYRRPAYAVPAAALLAFAGMSAYSFPEWFGLRDIAAYSLYFLLGHLAFLHYDRIASLPWKAFLPSIPAAAAFCWYGTLRHYSLLPEAFALLGILLSWLLARAAAASGGSAPERALGFVGAYSLDIYLFHYLFQIPARILLLQVLGLSSPAWILAMFPVSLLGPVALSKLVLRRSDLLALLALGKGRTARPESVTVSLNR